VTTREEASRANERGNDAKEAKRLDEAEAEYLRARSLAPDFDAPWFNLGVLYKWQARWPEARSCVERALELGTENRAGALWNLGIIATAQGDWAVARRAWTEYGIDVPEGEGPIQMALGLTPVRMKVDGHEVVWCDRIDPARAVVRSIPIPESGRRFGDLLLHDGAPAGHRMLGGREVAVFDELALLAPSSVHTYAVTVLAPSRAAMEKLLRAFSKASLPVEDWSDSVRLICEACSVGRPHAHDAHDEAERPWNTERRVGVAAE